MIPVVKRPSIVTLAGALFYAVAAILVLRAILPLPFLGAVTDAAKQAYATSTDPNLTGENFARAVEFGLVASSVLSVLLGIGLALLAMFDLRGKNVARILTWVFGGIGVLCCGLGSAVSGVSNFSTRSNNDSGVDTKAAAKAIADAYPSWFQPVSIALTVLMTVALIAVIIMLLLPESNAYFRAAKSGAAQVPPTAEPPYPTLPA